MKKPIDLVMFDLDGTLADTGRDLASAVNYTRSRFNLEPMPESLIYSHVGRGVDYLVQHSIPRRDPEEARQAGEIFLDRYEDHLLDTTALYPHVEQVLDYFKGNRRVVVSNKLYRFTVAVLRGLGIERCFDAIRGGDSGSKKKPDPALLQGVLLQFRIPAARALMVGDGGMDIEAGKRAGVLTCGVTYGLGEREELTAARPDLLIDDLGQLLQHFC